MSKRFTYGDQFSPDSIDLDEIIKICKENEPDRTRLQEAIRQKYWASTSRSNENENKLAMNTVLSVNAYDLIDLEENGESYEVTNLAKEIVSQIDVNEKYNIFAKHILTECTGLTLLRAIRNKRRRGEKITLESLAHEIQDYGYKLPPNSTYHSTMRQWLAQAGVFPKRGYDIDWEKIQELIGFAESKIEELYSLTNQQKYFLMSLLDLNPDDFISSSDVAKHTRSVYRIDLTTKQLVKDIINPLENKGLLDSQKTTSGRGAKPHQVKLSQLSEKKILLPLLEEISEQTEVGMPLLDMAFEDVVKKLDSEDTHEKGEALELLAIWLIRILGLKFTGWRTRSHETAGAEIDVTAASARIIYNRWQIQCKNTSTTVGTKIIAREVGLTYSTNANVVMVVTTSTFSTAAKEYANIVMDRSPNYVILFDKDDINRMINNKTEIIEILNKKARQVFLMKEKIDIELD